MRIGFAPATVALVVLSAMASVPHFLGRPLPHALFISEILNHVPAGTPAEEVPEVLAQIQAAGGGQFLPEVLRGGQVWRLFTPMFVHLSWAHLILNMLALVQFGGLLERRYGVGRFLGLVAVLALISNVSQYVGAGPGFGGMSGVIFGLFGYVWIHGRVNPEGLGYVLDPQTVTATMVWFFLCFSGIIPIANFAHAGGLIAGGGPRLDRGPALDARGAGPAEAVPAVHRGGGRRAVAPLSRLRTHRAGRGGQPGFPRFQRGRRGILRGAPAGAAGLNPRWTAPPGLPHGAQRHSLRNLNPLPPEATGGLPHRRPSAPPGRPED